MIPCFRQIIFRFLNCKSKNASKKGAGETVKKIICFPFLFLLAIMVLGQGYEYFKFHRDGCLARSSIGQLVKLGDAGGFGEVMKRGYLPKIDRDYLTIRVETPLWGCGKGQIIVIEDFEENHFTDLRHDRAGRFDMWFHLYPTNQARVFFTVTTNKFYAPVYLKRHGDRKLGERWEPYVWTWEIDNQYHWLYHFIDRACSWWEPEYEDGWPTLYLTNAVRTLRTQPNWTNYYEVCREAFAYPSERTRKDAGFDLETIILDATQEQLDFMRDDLFFPDGMRDVLYRELEPAQKAKHPVNNHSKPGIKP